MQIRFYRNTLISGITHNIFTDIIFHYNGWYEEVHVDKNFLPLKSAYDWCKLHAYVLETDCFICIDIIGSHDVFYNKQYKGIYSIPRNMLLASIPMDMSTALCVVPIYDTLNEYLNESVKLYQLFQS